MSVRPAKREELAWLTARSSWVPTDAARGILREEAGCILSMVVFDEWTPNAARIHVAVDAPPPCKDFICAAFEYPFLEANKGVLLCTVPAHNWRCLRLVHRLGFTEQHRVTDGWETGTDLVEFEMRKENCRWLRRERKAA